MEHKIEIFEEENSYLFRQLYEKNFSPLKGEYSSLFRRGPKGELAIYITPKIISSLKFILRGILELIHAEVGILFLQKHTGKRISLRSHGEPLPELIQKIVDLATEQNNVLSYKKNENVIDSSNQIIGQAELDLIVTPIGIEEENFGALLFLNPKTKDFFDAEDEQILITFSDTLATLLRYSVYDEINGELLANFSSSLMLFLEKTYLFQKFKRSNSTLAEVINVSKLINSSEDLPSLLLSILSSAKKVLTAESSSLLLIDESNNELFFNSVAGEKEKELKEIRVPMGKGIAGLVAETGDPLIINDAEHDTRVLKSVDEKTNFTTRNLMAAPLQVRNKTIGVIEVINSLGRTQFNASDLHLFMSFSDHAALAINNRDLIDNLKKTNISLQRKVSELSTLFQIGTVITEAKNEQEIFDKSVRIVAGELKLKSAALFILNKEIQKFSIVSQFGLPRLLAEQREIDFSETIVHDFFEKIDTILLHDIDNVSNPRIQKLREIGFKQVDLMLTPFIVNREVIGFMSFASEPNQERFIDADEQLVNAIVNQIQKGYEGVLLQAEIIENETFKKEVETSKKIQTAILPHSLPKITGFDLAAISVPAKQVGGDFYDFHVLDENHLGLTIADVSGKSLPAALFMASTASIIRTLNRNFNMPDELLNQANDLIYSTSQSGMFVTLFYLLLDRTQNKIHFGSAGHNQQLLIKNDGSIKYLHAKGSPLGIIPSSMHGKFGHGYEDIAQGDIIVMYTDGVVEAINSRKEEFEMERFIEVLKQTRDLSSKEIIDAVFAAVENFAGNEPQFDDFTMVVLKLNEL